MIWEPNFRLVVAGEHHLFTSSVLKGGASCCLSKILYARQTLEAYHLIIEEDSATVITWIQGYTRGGHAHPFLQDISIFFLDCHVWMIRHVYLEANIVTDWMTSCIVDHLGES